MRCSRIDGRGLARCVAVASSCLVVTVFGAVTALAESSNGFRDDSKRLRLGAEPALPWLGQGILPAERSEPASRSGEGQALASIASFVQVSPEWCDHVSGGSPGGADIAVDFSAAHALVRQFSMASPWGTADRALVSAMGEAGPLTPAGVASALETYADAIAAGDVCAVTAEPGRLGAARVHVIDRVAIVRPGIGRPAIPATADIVVLDLRDLPQTEDLEAALQQAVGAALKTPVKLPARAVRVHDGPFDEAFSPFNVYETTIGLTEPSPLPVRGRRDLPLVLLVGDRMAPAAAELAAVLRFDRRAWILGHDVYTEVAEADWRGAGAAGLAVRTALLQQVTRPAPEVFPQQQAAQDDPNDPATSSYRRDLTVAAGTRLLAVSIDANPAADLDLYLVHDANDDGVFDLYNEFVAFSATASSDEALELSDPAPGDYQIFVHGWFVPSPVEGSFDLTVDRVLGTVLPDRIAADAASDPTSDQEIVASARALVGSPPAPVSGPAQRPAPLPINPFGDFHPEVTAKPEMRAALLIVHGMTRSWFPYFDVVGDHIDERLQETLTSLEDWDGTDRIAGIDLVRRFGETLHDGHQFTVPYDPLFAGYIPVFLEQIDGRPVVRRSAIDTIEAGDTILAINGRPIEDIYAEQYGLTSAATPGYQFDLASRIVSLIHGPTTLLLADPDGNQRTVVIEPQSFASYLEAVDPGVSDRNNGALDDLGAPDLYYLNMNYFTTPSTADLEAALADATQSGARGLVVDMRHFPGANGYVAAMRLIREPFLSPQFHVRTRIGPDMTKVVNEGIGLAPITSPPVWDGPIVLLTGPHAVSSAENFMQMLVGADRLKAIVGQRSAGTNGNITGLSLPGGLAFLYTGMEVRNPDGSTFHGEGIEPDVEVEITAADLRDGIDRDLLEAIGQFDRPGKGHH